MLKWNLSDYNLEDRFFIRMLYLAMFISIMSIIENVAIHLPFHANYKWFAVMSISYFCAYNTLKLRHIFFWKNIIFFTIVFIILPIGWMIYGAYNYLTMSYASLICIAICFILEGRCRIFYLISELLMICTLFLLNEKLPILFRDANSTSNLLDLTLQVPLTFGAIAYISISYANAWRKEHHMLEKLSKEDALTGVYNRRFIFQYLNKVKNQKKEVQIAMIDIDNFKTVNDYLGHIVGDKVICQVSHDIQEVFKDHGIIGRYGGDEFIIIMEDLGLHECITRLEQLRHLLKNSIQYKDCPITFSCGLAALKADSNIDEVLSRADKLLYKTKNTGKDGIASNIS